MRELINEIIRLTPIKDIYQMGKEILSFFYDDELSIKENYEYIFEGCNQGDFWLHWYSYLKGKELLLNYYTYDYKFDFHKVLKIKKDGCSYNKADLIRVLDLKTDYNWYDYFENDTQQQEYIEYELHNIYDIFNKKELENITSTALNIFTFMYAYKYSKKTTYELLKDSHNYFF